VVWATTLISALLLVVLAWGFLRSGRSRRPEYSLPPREVTGAERVGRVWTDNDPVLVVDSEAAKAWTGVEGDYERISGQALEVGGLPAAVLMPEIDEGPVDVFALAGGDLLLLSVTAADAEDWDEFLSAVGRSPARETGRIDVPSGKLAVFHATAAHAGLRIVEGAAAAGGTPFAEELLAIPVRPGSYAVRESVVDAPSHMVHAWRLTPMSVSSG
jgi:hypothetical protein